MVPQLSIQHGTKMNQTLPTMTKTVLPFTRVWVRLLYLIYFNLQIIWLLSRLYGDVWKIISFAGFWNDINCGVELPSICKRSDNFASSTAAPTTAPKGGCSSDWTAFQGKVGEFTLTKTTALQRYWKVITLLNVPPSMAAYNKQWASFMNLDRRRSGMDFHKKLVIVENPAISAKHLHPVVLLHLFKFIHKKPN